MGQRLADINRFAKDGDEFHYAWGARQCLELLSLTGDLVSITVEGPSLEEARVAQQRGEQIIDVGLYYGSEKPNQATALKYAQLKHSTVRVAQPWTLTELKPTLAAFADRYRAISALIPADKLGIVEFAFVTNRPIHQGVHELRDQIALGQLSKQAASVKSLQKATGLDKGSLQQFCEMLNFRDDESNFLEQRSQLGFELSEYLGGQNADALLRLMDLVRRKATTEYRKNNSVTRTDVLRSLGVQREEELFPARNLIQLPERLIRRESETALADAIWAAEGKPVIVVGDGGSGKSVFAATLGQLAPPQSLVVLYDCFANGEYRRRSSPRHRSKDALVQMANELASAKLVMPLLPQQSVDRTTLMRAFLQRLENAVKVLRQRDSNAILCLAIDAADNAEDAAREAGDGHSFAHDLLRETMPAGVRLVLTCRPYRVHMLEPMSTVLKLPLEGYTRAETALNLRNRHPEASDHDVEEFHRLTSHNPRLQEKLLAAYPDLGAVFSALGPNPGSVETAIAALLTQAVAKLRDSGGSVGAAQVNAMCEALAALRPLVPVDIVAKVAGVAAEAVTSFALDLDGALLVRDGWLQFHDEPTETWFKNEYRPQSSRMAEFAGRLEPLAGTNAYAASSLPQLLLEAGHHEQLVALALTGRSLPDRSPLERRDIELQRLTFAFRASVRVGRMSDAAKLALKAGGVTAAAERQQKLLQENADIAGTFMDPQLLLELVERRTFGGNWLGAHYAYEALLLSAHAGTKAEARSRLRLAFAWLRNWGQLPGAERSKEKLKDEDLCAISLARLNLQGAKDARDFVIAWSPRYVPFRVGLLVASSLVDQGNSDVALELLSLSKDYPNLAIAIAAVLVENGVMPPKSSCAFFARGSGALIRGMSEDGSWNARQRIPRLTIAIALMAIAHQTIARRAVVKLLEACLTDDYLRMNTSSFRDRHVFRIASLRAALGGSVLQLRDLAHEKLRKELDELKPDSHPGESIREFKEGVEPLIPWCTLWASIVAGTLDRRIALTRLDEASSHLPSGEARQPNRGLFLFDEIGDFWFEILLALSYPEGFDRLLSKLDRQASTAFWLRVAHRCARSDSFSRFAHQCLEIARNVEREDRVDAEMRASSALGLARAILPIDYEEAVRAFERSVDLASGVGGENLARWDALLALAKSAALPGAPQPQLAYRLTRATEFIRSYLDREKHFDAAGSVEAIAQLCPSTALAAMSRWVDRDFSYESRYLSYAVLHLANEGFIRAPNVLCFVAFDHLSWPHERLLQIAGATASPADRENYFSLLARRLSLESGTHAQWRALEEVASSLGVITGDLARFGHCAFLPSIQSSITEIETVKHPAESAVAEPSWEKIFENCDVETPAGLQLAYRRHRGGKPPFETEHFVREALLRVPPQRAIQFIRAFREADMFGLWTLRALLEQVPSTWLQREAVRGELRVMVETQVRREPSSLQSEGRYQPLSMELLTTKAFISPGAIVRVALDALGERDEVLPAHVLFNGAALAGTLLDSAEAQEVLSYGLELLEEHMSEEDGDGPWRAALTPPQSPEAALAGFLWAALAAPSATRRWQAAHSVRILCSIGATSVLQEIRAFAEHGTGGCFVDSKLVFYAMHAKQWLLFALAASAHDNPNAVLPFSEFLEGVALSKEGHVIMRAVAAQTLLILQRSGCLSLATETTRKLRLLNHPMSVTTDEKGVRGESWAEDRADRRFMFGYDMDRYWYEPLARQFGIKTADVERIAETFIFDHWGFQTEGGWKADMRVHRNLYGQRGNWHSHASYPRYDDLSFYLSYHALMCAAGTLVDSRPLMATEISYESWHEWLCRHWLTRRDGLWLFDRRDPVPPGVGVEREVLQATSDTGDMWRVAFGPDDASRLLCLNQEQIVVGGWWDSRFSPRSQSVHVNSALVSPGSAMALVRAMQTSSSPFRYGLPDPDDSAEIAQPGYRLRGWLNTYSRSLGVDEFDSWSGSIRLPAPGPAKWVREALGIASDPERREWLHDGKVALRTEVWGTFQKREEENSPSESGWRVFSHKSFLSELLQQTSSSLIVSVTVRREWSNRYGESSIDPDGLRYIPYVFFFLIASDGTVQTLH